MPTRRWICALLCFAAVGCGGSGGGGVAVDATPLESPTPAPAQDRGISSVAPVAPIGEGQQGRAIAAPITIPDFTADQGADFNDALTRADIEEPIKAACGDGTLCVGYQGVPDDEDGGRPCIIAAVPRGTAERGSTITFLLEAACDSPSPSADDGFTATESATVQAS